MKSKSFVSSKEIMLPIVWIASVSRGQVMTQIISVYLHNIYT